MRRSTQKEVTDILRQFGTLKGEKKATIQVGRLVISDLYCFYQDAGYSLTPYANGVLSITWVGKHGEPHFNCLRTSPEEAFLHKDKLIQRVAAFRKTIISSNG